ncbi:MAG TPA: hypothetical protein VEA15_09680 [Caulobacteraceae bacterium]|nr:hypothetical protein [Caulobacteraceae bacterium]
MIAQAARFGLLLGLAAAFLLGWLPMIRGLLDGPSYEWGLTLFGRQFSGAGLEGDYWYVVGHTLVGLVLIWLGCRNPGGTFKIAVLAYAAAMLGDSLWTAFVAAEERRFEGATLGITLSAETIFLLVYGVMFALALVWTAFGRTADRPRWTPANTVFLTVAILLLPLQSLLLGTGQGREASDQFGVLITIGQWLLVCVSFAPLAARRRSTGLASA